MSLSFHTFDPATQQLEPASGTVEAYPGGDIAVRHLAPAPTGQHPIAWHTGGALNYAALGQWVAFHAGAKPTLVMPYLPSARGDHDPTQDAPGAARLTAATGITDVIAVDPHSPAWAAAAAGFGLTVHTIAAAEIIVESALAAMQWEAVIAPDKGAVGRAGLVAVRLGTPLLTAGKVRNPHTGALSGFSAPEGIKAGRYLVVDDICDGGGTFGGLAQTIRATQPGAELHLWVTHGLFTGRWRDNLLANFAAVTTANTGPNNDAAPAGVRQICAATHIRVALSRRYQR